MIGIIMERIQRELFNQQDIGYQQFMSKCIPDAYFEKNSFGASVIIHVALSLIHVSYL